MFKVAAAATAAAAVAQNPAAPTWPKEFTCQLDLVDFRHNHTESSDFSFSVSNLGSQDDYSRFRNVTWVAFHDYKQHVDFEIIEIPGHPQCHQQPNRGDLPIPPVNTFTYNGTGTFPDGTAYYRWVDPQGRGPAGGFEYFTTADANEYPLAFYDHAQEIAQEFKNFAPQTSWPNGFWNPPTNCRF